MHRSPQEVFWALGYGPALNIATLFEVNRGMYAYVDLHIPSMMSGLLLAGCERFWLAHNHSNNNPNPTEGDIKLTRAVMAAANVLNLHFEDHVILTPTGGFYSMEHEGIMVRDPQSPYPATRAAQAKR
jgi:DNA repair protein RadC